MSPIVVMENSYLRLKLVPSWGSNLISIFYKSKNLEILRRPKDESEFYNEQYLFGNPVLFPPNRIADGRFSFKNNIYSLRINEPDRNNHIHGIVYDKPWVLTDQNATGVTTYFDSAAFPDVESQYGHHFALKLMISLVKEAVVLEMNVYNLSDSEMPIGLGYHTTFVCSSDIEITAPVLKRWKLDERCLPTGELEETNTKIPTRKILDDAYLVDPAVENDLSLEDFRRGVQVRYRCDKKFTQWVIYSRNIESGFICLEPYTWITNAPNLNLPSSITGFRTLLPGETDVFETKIEINDIY